MQGWYEFGFSGFPSGEQRRRFYRQRDDPCDSEEDGDYDDENTDRPVIHYPLRMSEEGSRSPSDSAWSSDASSASDAPALTSADSASFCASQVGRRHRRSGRRARRAVGEEDATLRCVLRSTLNEDMPAWYGATAVTLATACGTLPAADFLSLQHGGAPCASPFSISAQASLWHWTAVGAAAAALPSSSAARDEATGSLRCRRVPDDPSLLSRLCWERLHPALRLARGSATPPPPRIGHCAAALTNIDSTLLRFFLTDQHSGDHATSTTMSGSSVTRSSSSTGIRTTASAPTTGLLLDSDVHICASLVLGGASQLVNASGSDPFSLSPGLRDGRGGHHHRDHPATTSATRGQPNLDNVSLPRAGLLSHPALCLTLWTKAGTAESGDGKSAAAALRHHSFFLPLDTPSMSIIAARAFASLTPWVDPSASAAAACAFAYLGGTDNGRDPLSFLELEIFSLHLDTWTWSCTPATTYGAKPAPRFGHSASMVDNDSDHHDEGYLLLFGGIGSGRAYLCDLHVLDVRTRVWREVFMPSGLGISRRAFHMTAVLKSSSGMGGRGNETMVAASTVQPQLSTFAVQSRLALQQQHDEEGQAVFFDASARADGEEAQDEGDSAVWSSSVTTARSCSTLVVLGGECNGRPVATSWACTLCSGKWRRLSFPLRTLPHFFHVTAPSTEGGGSAEAWRVRRQLPRAEFRAAVGSMVERTAESIAAEPSSVAPPISGSTPEDAYMAACHGSLAQLLVCQGSRRCVLVGGSRGPPVSIATQVEVMGSTLKDTTSLWLLAAQLHGPMSDDVLRRVPNLQRFFFHRSGVLSRAVGSLLQPSDALSEQRRRPLSEADVRSDRLVSESVLDGQLTEWTRLARKRLRDTG